MDWDWFALLKMWLILGPALGFGALELILLRRDRRRDAARRAAAGPAP